MKYDQENPTAAAADDANQGSKSPVKGLIARVVTLLSLIVSIAVLKTNRITFDGLEPLTYHYYRSYQYMMYAMVLGALYTVLQIPFAVYYMMTKKFLINSIIFLKFDFYADKVLLFLLATATGAGFGMTMDSKRVKWEHDNDQLQTFFSINYTAAALCLAGCLASTVSSVNSSLALLKIN